MFGDEILAMANASKAKVSFARNNMLGYFIASMLAGAYVGLGIILIFTSGGVLAGAPATKIVMGASFGIALSLVIMAGSELFTGNNLILSVGILKKTVTVSETLKLWLVCLMGNWAGAIILSIIYWGTGLTNGPVGEFMAATAATKMSIPLLPLFLRGILCNVLVCLAVWCNFKLKSEVAKLIMIFWCLYAFITSGYEHSIANMTLLTIGLLSPFESAVSLSGYFYNLSVVVLGNMVGAIVFLAIPYYAIAKKKED